MKALVGVDRLEQWINGSFVTTKAEPNDIDLVTFLDAKLVEQHAKKLGAFLNADGKRNYGVDGYVVKLYADDHQLHMRTVSDRTYWNYWFSTTKPNHRKKRFSKGFINLID